jgi:cytochrome P450
MHVMHDLAASPEYQEPLRAEIESVVGKFGGWTKQALTAMKKLDSVLRESQRLNGIALVAGMRKSLVPHTFSDGTFVPKGTWVAAPAAAVHRDVDVYENAGEFDGFRFARIREQPGQEAKHQMVSITSDYLAFGMGNHAW